MNHRIRFILRTLVTGTIFLIVREPACAQDSQASATQTSAWLDEQTLMENTPHSLPSWITLIERIAIDSENDSKTIYRIHFTAIPTPLLSVRIMFQDKIGAQPLVAAWSGKNELIVRKGPLGSGLDLPSSETVILPAAQLAYLDIDVPEKGGALQGVFLAGMESVSLNVATDFKESQIRAEKDSGQKIADVAKFTPFLATPDQALLPFAPVTPIPFHFETMPGSSPLPVMPSLADGDQLFPTGLPFPKDSTVAELPADTVLLGRVKAMLSEKAVKLGGDQARQITLTFDLEKTPLAAVVTFEILNDELGQEPQIICNGLPLGATTVSLPDLADPAFEGRSRPIEPDFRITYRDWLRGQKSLPASALREGKNTIVLQLPQESKAVGMRKIELQLKYNSGSFHYSAEPH